MQRRRLNGKTQFLMPQLKKTPVFCVKQGSRGSHVEQEWGSGQDIETLIYALPKKNQGCRLWNEIDTIACHFG